MAITEREEFYVENGHLVSRTGRRPCGYGRWPNANPRDLAMAEETAADGLSRVVGGERHSKAFEMEAVAQAYNFNFGDEHGPDVGQQIPHDVVDRIRTRIDEVAKKVTTQYRSLSNEERMTGALFGSLPREFDVGEWKVRFHNQG